MQEEYYICNYVGIVFTSILAYINITTAYLISIYYAKFILFSFAVTYILVLFCLILELCNKSYDLFKNFIEVYTMICSWVGFIICAKHNKELSYDIKYMLFTEILVLGTISTILVGYMIKDLINTEQIEGESG